MNPTRPIYAAIVAMLLMSPAAALAGPACSASASGDIVDTAVSAGNFSTLIKAVQAAGLEETLRSEGPFTVFAPTDAAFAALPAETLQSLLKPENRDQLASILTYHVLPGKVMASAVTTTPKADTVEGASVLFSSASGKAFVNRARIVKTDIKASNGVIHVIDAVILPPTIAETAQTAGSFQTLLAAAKAAGLAEALSSEGDLTVFAPTDAAFAKLPEGTVESLLKPENRDKLAAVLKYHVVPRRITLEAIPKETLQGESVHIRPSGAVRINDANVVMANVKATNGVVHVIDRVLLPPQPAPTAARMRETVREAVAGAVRSGAPKFNAGHHGACAAIYERTARTLLNDHADAMSPAVRTRLKTTLASLEHHRSAAARAWALRHALDAVYADVRDG